MSSVCSRLARAAPVTHFSCLDWLFGMSAETEWTLSFKLD